VKYFAAANKKEAYYATTGQMYKLTICRLRVYNWITLTGEVRDAA